MKNPQDNQPKIKRKVNKGKNYTIIYGSKAKKELKKKYKIRMKC